MKTNDSYFKRVIRFFFWRAEWPKITSSTRVADPTTNQVGANKQIQYMESNNTPRTAYLDQPYEDITFGMHDTEWHVLVPGGQWDKDHSFQWLTYMGPNGLKWVTRTHCDDIAKDGSGTCIVTHQSDEQDPKNTCRCFYFFDWNMQLWKMDNVTYFPGDDQMTLNLRQVADWDPNCKDTVPHDPDDCSN